MEDKYATREEVAELKALHAKTTDDMHKRLNSCLLYTSYFKLSA